MVTMYWIFLFYLCTFFAASAAPKGRALRIRTARSTLSLGLDRQIHLSEGFRSSPAQQCTVETIEAMNNARKFLLRIMLPLDLPAKLQKLRAIAADVRIVFKKLYSEGEKNKFSVRWPGIEPGSTAWKATMLTITPPSHLVPHSITHRDQMQTWSISRPNAGLINIVTNQSTTVLGFYYTFKEMLCSWVHVHLPLSLSRSMRASLLFCTRPDRSY